MKQLTHEEFDMLYGPDVRARKLPAARTIPAVKPNQSYKPSRVPACGFDSEKHSLARCVAHWMVCDKPKCRESWRNYQSFKAEMIAKYGD